MAIEIERKFLTCNTSYRAAAVEAKEIRQGYLTTDQNTVVRVRVYGERAYITVKTRNKGAVRSEWEYEIPKADALQMLQACHGRVIVKTRYIVNHESFVWEIDEFGGDLAPLVVAEIELPAVDTHFPLPNFIGEEVTDDPRYFNSALAAQV